MNIYNFVTTYTHYILCAVYVTIEKAEDAGSDPLVVVQLSYPGTQPTAAIKTEAKADWRCRKVTFLQLQKPNNVISPDADNVIL